MASKYDSIRKRSGQGGSRYDAIRNRTTNLAEPEPLKIRTPDRAFNQPGRETSVSELMRQSPLESFKKNWPTTQSQPAPVATSPTQTSELVDRPPYLERVKQRASEWPELLKPIGLAVEGLAQAPFMLATRESLGTTRSEEEGFKPVSGAGRIAGDILAPVGTALTMPGSGLPGTGLAGGAMYNQAGHVITRAAPRLGTTAGGRVAETSIKSAAEGVPLNVGTELALNPEASGRDLALAAGLGGVGGAVLGAAGKGIGEGISVIRGRSARDTAQEILESATRRKQEGSPGIISRSISTAGKAIEELGDIATGGMNSGARFGGQSAQAASPTLRHIVSSGRREVPSLGGVSEKTYIDLVDDLFSLKKTDDLVASAKGGGLKPTESAYELALQSRGSAQQARQIMKDKLININGEVIGDSLKDVLTPVGRKNIRQFEDYMLNRHAITRFDRNERVFDKLPDGREWTPEIGREIIANYEAKFPEFADAANALKQFDDQFNQAWRVESGLLKPEVIAAWKDQNPDYINMNRYFSDLEKTGNGFGAKRGLAGQKDPTKGYTKGGSRRKIIRPIESKIRAIDATVKSANRNRSMQALVKNIQEYPEVFEGIAEIVPENPSKFNLKDIDLSSPDGLDVMMLRFDDAYENILRSSRKDLDNVVPVMVNGEPVYVRIQNKNLLEAVTSINSEALDSMTRLANMLTNSWKAMLTGINPVFTLTRSILRDPVSAFVQSGSNKNPIKFINDITQGAWEIMRNGELYKDYKRLGGGFNSPNVGTPRLVNRTVRDIVPSDNVMEGIVQRFGDKMLDTLNRIESIPRLGEYKRLRGSGTIDERLRALYESREVAVNFQRKGRKGRYIDAYFPYFNAAIQSIDKLARSIKDRPGSTLAKIGLTVTTPSVLLYLLNSSNPDYQKLRENEKDRFFHFPIGDGKFVRYPIPQEIIPFTSLPRRVLQQVREKDPDAWNEFGTTLAQNIIPPGVGGAMLGFAESGFPGAAIGIGQDTFAGPLVDVASNKTWTGSPIVPGYLENVSPQNQVNERTSGVAKRIAGLTGGSPMQIDYLIRQYGGDLGNIATSVIDKGVPKAGAGLIEGIGKRLVVDSNVSDSALNDFYGLKEKFDKMYADLRATGEVPKGYNDGVRIELNRVANSLSDIGKAIRAIDSSNMTDKEKNDQKRELTVLRNSVARNAYQTLQELK